jgi:hypothetical protein
LCVRQARSFLSVPVQFDIQHNEVSTNVIPKRLYM